MSDSPKMPPPGPKLTLTPPAELGTYSNFVSIAHNYSEVVMDFGRTLPGRTDIPVVARVLMTPFQAKQMLRALTHNLKMYEETYGAIGEPPVPVGPEHPETN